MDLSPPPDLALVIPLYLLLLPDLIIKPPCVSVTVRHDVTPGEDPWHHHLSLCGSCQSYPYFHSVPQLPQYPHQYCHAPRSRGLCPSQEVQYVSVWPGGTVGEVT